MLKCGKGGENMSLFDEPIESLKGVGKKRSELFLKLGIKSVGDLILFFPRSYENWSKITDIAAAPSGVQCCVKAQVITPVSTAYARSGMIVSHAAATDDTAVIKLVFFNNKYISSMLHENETYYFYGRVEKNLNGYQMTSPRFFKATAQSGLQPIYSLTSGLSLNTVTNAVKQALSRLPDSIKDPLPEFLTDKYGLCSYDFAIRNIHFPKSEADLEKARNRLIFDELLLLTLGLANLKSGKKEISRKPLENDFTEDFLRLLPFKMTNAQLSALSACADDMLKSPHPMQRLIQGDVGSGKTAVAAGVCYLAVKNGFQAAFMAPTEILAQQHFKSLSSLFKNENIRIQLLTGSMSAAEKRKAREAIAGGEADIIVGTHALITDSTQFANLCAVITDEQHRFGVAQRTSLTRKAEAVNLLVMSATPIPRTLGLTLFGDLDITVIDELPPGRQKIDTFLICTQKRSRALSFIKKEVSLGRQAYIVCPLVEQGESDLANTENYAAELMLSELSDCPVGILHGKMKPFEKEDVMRRFADGEISVLVSTTVVEVGVDVPNATVMMIENAERFGLSTLHQLRGRVGRGKAKSLCILVSDSKNEKTLSRLEAMCKTNDGFEIAEQDLKNRGPGDFFGERQHGLLRLRIAELTDMQGLENAQAAAKRLLEISPDLSLPEFRGIKAQLNRMFRDISVN